MITETPPEVLSPSDLAYMSTLNERDRRWFLATRAADLKTQGLSYRKVSKIILDFFDIRDGRKWLSQLRDGSLYASVQVDSFADWCFERRGGLVVFRFAGYTHIHSHCLVLLPLMSHFLKGKPEIWGKMIWQNWQNTQNAQSVSFVIIGGFLSLGQQRESAATQGFSIGLRMSVVLCGEFCQSLLVLICISLSLSWILRESLIFF